ncbi:MAG TPA: hypothetical protein DDZ89_01010 [Clostridiales bacterium]|nr:hypothetical protein [Clostridiales bacterium]
MAVRIEKVSYKGFEDCIRMSNDTVDLIITTGVGPRILRYGFVNRGNVFCNVEEQMGKTGEDQWNIFGGHRLWHSPEARPRSYVPDNFPIDYRIEGNTVFVSQPVEKWVQIKKDIAITLENSGTKVTLSHTLTNKNAWDVECSLWALTVVAPGGTEVVPQCQIDTDLLPNRMISLWPYAKMNDPRVVWGEKYILLKQDPKTKQPFKVGISNFEGWVCYANNQGLFVKRFDPIEGALYPDYSASTYETYTTDYMLEMESLSPLTRLKPDGVVTHEERWFLFDQTKIPYTEEDVDKTIIPFIEKTY